MNNASASEQGGKLIGQHEASSTIRKFPLFRVAELAGRYDEL